jgi:hypothetical protein
MQDVVGIVVTDGTRKPVAFLTWGRVFDRVNEKPLLDALRKGLRKFGVSQQAKISVCNSLQEVAGSEFFYEGLCNFAWKPIPFGKRSYPVWALRMRKAIAQGKEIWLIGTVQPESKRRAQRRPQVGKQRSR